MAESPTLEQLQTQALADQHDKEELVRALQIVQLRTGMLQMATDVFRSAQAPSEAPTLAGSNGVAAIVVAMAEEFLEFAAGDVADKLMNMPLTVIAQAVTE